MTAFDKNISLIRPLEKGRFRARLAQNADDVKAAQRLRTQMFLAQNGAGNDCELDADRFDAICQHILIEDITSGAVVGCFRFLHLNSGADFDISYSAQFYNLQNLKGYAKPALEIGRFCLANWIEDSNILRIGWAMLTRYVDAHGIGLLFGCSSFAGTNPDPYKDALILLKERYIAPNSMQVLTKAAETLSFAQLFADQSTTLAQANAVMPSLLRTYLAMGGWVSDHAVIDRALETFHVFTAVEIEAIPPRRAELLRADAR